MTESAGTLGAPTAKVPHQDQNWKHCLCHVRSVSGELTPFTAAIELGKASRISQDDVHEQLEAHSDEGPADRPCYQTYINKTLMKRLQDKRERGGWASQYAYTSAQVDSSTNVRGVDHQRLHQGKIVASSVIRHGGGQEENMKH